MHHQSPRPDSHVISGRNISVDVCMCMCVCVCVCVVPSCLPYGAWLMLCFVSVRVDPSCLLHGSQFAHRAWLMLWGVYVCSSFLSSSWSMVNVSHAGADSSVGTVGYLFVLQMLHDFFF